MIEIEFNKAIVSSSGRFQLELNLRFNEKECVALYGASGAGKSSTLRTIAGLIRVDKGFIKVGNEVWEDTNQRIRLTPQQRRVGIVFQDYALFPNMAVRENILFAVNREPNPINVDELVELMDLGDLLKKRPDQLSGGQKQRVALARALARKPKLLLLDEPFTALDTDLKLRMQELIKRMHDQFQLTTILVSHDILDVAQLASKVFVMENGSIAREGKPSEVIPPEHVQHIGNVLREKFNFRS